MTSGMRSASERRLGVAECEAGVPGAEKSRDGEGEGLVRGVRSEELKEEKSITSPFSRTISGRRPRLVNLTGVEEVLRSRKPAASFWALRISLASWVRDLFSFSSMADSTGLRLTRFLSPSTVMMGSRGGFEAAKEVVCLFQQPLSSCSHCIHTIWSEEHLDYKFWKKYFQNIQEIHSKTCSIKPMHN